MPQIQQTNATKAIRAVAGVIGLLAVAYFLFLVYRVYFFESNRSSSALSALPFVLINMALVAMTIEFARSVWRRSLGVHSNAWQLRAFAVILIVFPVLVSPLSPTTLVFAMSTLVLIFVNLVLNRLFAPQPAN